MATLPLNAYFCRKTDIGDPMAIRMAVRCAFAHGVVLSDNSERGCQRSYAELQSGFVYTVDGGATWKPCEVVA